MTNWQKKVDKSDWPVILLEVHNLAAKYQHFSFNGNYQYVIFYTVAFHGIKTNHLGLKVHLS